MSFPLSPRVIPHSSYLIVCSANIGPASSSVARLKLWGHQVQQPDNNREGRERERKREREREKEREREREREKERERDRECVCV